MTDLCSSTELQIGTFSHFFNRAIQGYEKLPDWTPEDQLPPESVRNTGHIESPKTAAKGKVKEGESSDDDEELSDFFGSMEPKKEEESVKDKTQATAKAENDDNYYSYGYYSDDE